MRKKRWLVQKQKMEQSKWDDAYEQEFQEYLAGRRSENYEYLQKQKIASRYPKMDEREEAYQKLVEERSTVSQKLCEPDIFCDKQRQ